MKRLSSLFLALSLAVCALAANVTTVFTVNPGMSCQNCENKIKSNLRFEKGVKDIVTSLADQTVTITYDDTKTTPNKLIAAFKTIGYTAQTGVGCKKAEGKCKKAEGSCCKKAEGACKKAEGGCCKKAEGACKKAEGACKKAEGSCCKKTEGACKKAEGACKKAEGGCCKKAEVKCKKAEKNCCKNK